LWSVHDKKHMETLKWTSGSIHGIRFDREGLRLCAWGGEFRATDQIPGEAVVWDMKSKKILCNVKAHTNGITSGEFLPGGTHLVTGGWDGAVKIWDIAKGDSK
jgi:WD40 repeat protein